MIYCTKCGTANLEHAIYCIEDGQPLHKSSKNINLIRPQNYQQTCFSCGADQEEHHQYCHVCGESVERVHVYEVEMKSHHPHYRKTLKEVNKSMIRVIPFVLLSIALLIVFSSLILNIVQNTSDRSEEAFHPEVPEGFEQVEWIYNYRYLTDSYNQMKLEATGGLDQLDRLEGTEDINSILSPFDIILFANLSKVSVSLTDQSEQETFHGYQTTSRPGLVFYFFLALLSLAIAGLAYSFKAKINNWQDWVIQAISFSVVYSLIIFLFSLFMDSTHQIDHGHSTQVTSYIYQSFDVLLKSFLISFLTILSVLSFKKGWSQPFFVKGLKVSLLTVLTIVSVFMFVSWLLLTSYIKNIELYDFLIDSSLISGVVLVGQIAIYLLNFVFLNTIEIDTFGELGPGKISYQIFEKLNSPTNSELLEKGFHFIESFIWVLMGVTLIIIFIFSRAFKSLSNREKWLGFVVYSSSFAITLSAFTVAVTYFNDMNYTEDSNSFFIGFSATHMLIVSFLICLVISIIGSLTLKNRRSEG
ncbi:zinc ribbon domain-containing protein [Piscibacillus halophilus]|uniref:zinc ribbon domain-containing protein n=1 Tax=Piscibacillus halophilus TaxID=571933 RepID=UPI00158A46CF|nr:zinc ribbon domain-containing protein [Piscibacillus halophilus]